MSTLSNVSASVDTIGKNAWGSSQSPDLPVVIGNAISVLLGILGLLFLVLVIYAGFLYLTAQGEQDNVKKAKSILTKAVIGIVIILSSYAVTNLVVSAMTTLAPVVTTTP